MLKLCTIQKIVGRTGKTAACMSSYIRGCMQVVEVMVIALAALARFAPGTLVATTRSLAHLLSAVLRRLTCVAPAAAVDDATTATGTCCARAASPVLLDVLRLDSNMADRRRNPLDGRDVLSYLASVTLRDLLCDHGPSLVRTGNLLQWRRHCAIASCNASAQPLQPFSSLATDPLVVFCVR